MISQAQFAAEIWPVTAQQEGGYANTPGDRGGETYRGISRVHNPKWNGWPIIDQMKPLKWNAIIKSLEPNVILYYWLNYFVKFGFNNLNNSKIATLLFDWVVNGGYKADKVRTILNNRYGFKLPMGGGLSTDTVAAINKVQPEAFANELLEMRKAGYVADIQRNPSQAKFQKTWFKRIEDLRAISGAKKAVIGSTVIIVIAAIVLIIIFLYRKNKEKPDAQETPTNEQTPTITPENGNNQIPVPALENQYNRANPVNYGYYPVYPQSHQF